MATQYQKFLRTHDAAERIGVGKSTLEKLRIYGGGPPFVKIGRSVRYDVIDLDLWLSAHLRRSTSDVDRRG